MYQGEFGPVSNRGAWRESISLRQSGEAIPAIAEIELAFGPRKTMKTLTGGGIDYDTDAGVFSFLIPESEMRQLCPGRYDMGITITLSGVEEQLFAGSLVVIDGVVS